MPKANELTALKVKNAKAPGKSSKLFADGGGLYLQVTPSGAKSWVFKWKPSGAKWAREMGLGSAITYSLAEARDKALECRKLVAIGVDPIRARDDAEAAKAAALKQAATFRQVATDYIAAHKAGWKNAKHTQQWTNTLETYCGPVFGDKPVGDVNTEDVLKVLRHLTDPKKPDSHFWNTKTETASRLRNRIELILDYAHAHGMRKGENPARWRGHLDAMLPKPSKVAKAGHHAAMPFKDCPAFLRSVMCINEVAAMALCFTILTAARTNEIVSATWSEIDLDAGLWIIPAERMKAGREHRVPLSDSAVALLQRAKAIQCSDHVFPGRSGKKPLSTMAMAMMLRRMNRADITVHGFRSAFRDWAGECTDFPGEVCEMALAHVIRNQTEAAYRRGDLLDKRRALMQAWADYLAGLSATNVVPIKKTAA